MSDWLQRNFREVFELPDDAIEWLCMFYDALQFFDDVWDDDCKPTEDAFNDTLWNTLVGMPQNRFFLTHIGRLIPLMETTILKWHAANKIEADGKANTKSYMWRAGYFDVALAVVNIVHGPKAAKLCAHQVIDLYGENLNEYLQEFQNA